MFWWLKKRDYVDYNEKIEKIHSSLHKSFLNVKKDILGVVSILDKLKEEHTTKDKKITVLEKRIDDLEAIFVNVLNKNFENNKVFGQPFGRVFGHKQTDSCLKQNTVVVQTSRDSDKWTKNLTPMERAIINILLNTDMKLSYEDLSVMLGRDKSTIRGQVNNVKQKNESLLNEYLERNGKKRFFIDEKRKGEILKERAILVKRAKSEGSLE